jgi:condensin complex subunit 3
VCRDEEVQNETIKLICTAWMKTAKFNPITILQHLNVVEYEDACEKIIQALLDADDEMLAEHLSDPEIRAYWQGIESATTPIVVVADSGKPPSQDELLDVNMVFFARARCHYVKDTNKKAKNVTTTRQAEAILSKVLPDIPVLCEIFERHSAALIKAVVAGGQEVEESDDDMDYNNNNRRSSSIVVDAEKNQDALTLTCLQLLQMACMSSSEMEEGSRLHLKHTMTSMLGSIIAPDDVVEGCMATLQAIHNVNGNGGEVAYCRCVSDIVHQLQRDYEVVVSSGDDDGLNDNRLLRILSILSIVLEKVSSASPSIVADFATIIVPAVNCETNELVREAAVSCIGKLGLFTPEQTVLSDFKPLLLKMVSDEDETLEIRAQAMLALCDWSILFSDTLGSCPVAAADGDDVENDKSTPLVVAFPDLVFAMMAHEELGMVCVAAEVACKLLIMGKICDSSWLARLVTLFFDVRLNDDDEVMEDDGNDGNHPDADTAASEVGSPIRLQQLLSLFFPAYTHKSEQNRHALVGALSMILDSLLALHSQKRKRGRGHRACSRSDGARKPGQQEY